MNGFCYTCGAKISMDVHCLVCDSIAAESADRALANGFVIIDYKPAGRILELKDDAYDDKLFYGILDKWPNWTTHVYRTKCQVLSDLIDASRKGIVELEEPELEPELEEPQEIENDEDKS